MTPRVRAPELAGRGWLNTAGPIRLRDLRGRFVLLDFWTFCCINCLHVLDELRPVEEKYADELVVVGVHSPKFVHEADPDALAAAVERYERAPPGARRPGADHLAGLHRPGLADAGARRPGGLRRRAVRRRGARPRDRRAARRAGRRAPRPRHAPAGRLAVRPARAAEPTDLRFPAKAVALPGGGPPRRRRRPPQPGRAGRRRRRTPDRSGERGLADGVPPRFSEPNGLCLLPDDVAAEVGYDVVVADTVNHALRGVDLATGEVRTLAGDGQQWMQGDGTAPALEPLGRRLVAGPGLDRDGRHPPALDLRPAHRRARGRRPAPPTRGCVDGPLAEAWFAQTVRPGRRRRPALARRRGDLARCAGRRRTARSTPRVGTGLFDFGFRDGDRPTQALLQHPLGVTVLPDGLGRGRRHLQRRRTPLRPRDRRGDHAGHRPGRAERRRRRAATGLRRGRVGRAPAHPGRRSAASATHEEFAHRTQRPVTEVGGDARASTSTSRPPPGQKVDDRFGPPSQLVVTATPAGAAPRGRGPRHRPDPHAGRSTRRSARACCTSPPGPRPATPTAARARPATCTSRTGASRSGSSTAAPTRAASCRCGGAGRLTGVRTHGRPATTDAGRARGWCLGRRPAAWRRSSTTVVVRERWAFITSASTSARTPTIDEDPAEAPRSSTASSMLAAGRWRPSARISPTTSRHDADVRCPCVLLHVGMCSQPSEYPVRCQSSGGPAHCRVGILLVSPGT